LDGRRAADLAGSAPCATASGAVAYRREWFCQSNRKCRNVRRPEEATLSALEAGGARILVEDETQYQRILLVETPKKELLLLLDGEIQFYSGDEQRFHESLAIVPLLFHEGPVRRVGVMGGGDGLVARELLRHFGGELELVRVVDIDPAITELAKTHPRLLELSERSLLDERVEVINADARSYRSDVRLDVIICDLPDPTSPALARLYTREFYDHLGTQLVPEGGVLGVQIVYVPPLFDGVLSTLRSVFPSVREYATWMYSFVRAGFAVCGSSRLEARREIPQGTRHLTPESLQQMLYFAPDEPRTEVTEVSTDGNMLTEEWYGSYLREYFEERILYY
jgi:spermidine synthase